MNRNTFGSNFTVGEAIYGLCDVVSIIIIPYISWFSKYFQIYELV